MFISDVLKRAWTLATRHRALWILGMLLAITSGFSMTTGLPNTWEDTQVVDLQTWQLSPADREWVRENLGITLSNLEITVPRIIPPEISGLVTALVGFALVLAAALLLLFLIMLMVRYLAETGLIRSVNQIEEQDRPVGVWAGIKLGWSRFAWRLFAIDLVVFVALALLFTLMVVPPAVFIPMMAGLGEAALAFAVITMVGLSVPALLVSILLIAGATGFTRICHRASILQELGVFPAIGHGFQVIGTHIKDLGLLWLVMLGIDILWPFAMIPVLLVAVIASSFLSGVVVVPGMLALVAMDAAEWMFITGGVLSFLLFITLTAIPLIFAGGFKEAFTSSAWTVGYRELTIAKKVAEKPAGEPPAEDLALAGD